LSFIVLSLTVLLVYDPIHVRFQLQIQAASTFAVDNCVKVVKIALKAILDLVAFELILVDVATKLKDVTIEAFDLVSQHLRFFDQM
jgi:hypothetical protein